MFQPAVRLYPIYNTLNPKVRIITRIITNHSSTQSNAMESWGLWLRNFPDHLLTAAGSRWNRRLPVSCGTKSYHQFSQKNWSEVAQRQLDSTYFCGIVEISQVIVCFIGLFEPFLSWDEPPMPNTVGRVYPNSTLQCLQSTKCTPFVSHGFVGPHICGTRYQPFYATCAPQLCSSAVPLLSSVNVSTAAPHSLNLSSSPPWHRITALPAILPAIFPPQHAPRASPALSGWWVNAAFL